MKTPTLDFAFRITLHFDPGPRLRFDNAFGDFRRGYVGVLGGEISGPRLAGRVLPQSGGDWPRLWASGLVEFEAHYLLEADDSTPIYVHNRGIAYSSPETLRRIESGAAVDPSETYCRVTPRFEAPRGAHDWLGRTVFVGTGERRGPQSVFDYYAVT